MGTDLQTTVSQMLAYCQANDWAGYDPYDALNSRLLRWLPFLNSRAPRLVLTQALKRAPVNIRPLLLIPRTQNPKALALFLSGLVILDRIGFRLPDRSVDLMIDRLQRLRSPSVPYWCWGYSFPWQTRTLLVPAGAPNLVCTCFVANALLDAFERTRDERPLGMAVSAGRYIFDELYWIDGKGAGFSYPQPSSRVEVHNANFLAAALLCRLYERTGQPGFLDSALTAARFSALKQRADGSWFYGEGASQRWIDNFHTGYNLCALRTIAKLAGTREFDERIERGFEFYRTHFFCPDGSVRYFHDRAYPKDIHCVAQSVLTLVDFRHMHPDSLALARAAFQWAMDHMWDPRGYFYYRALRSGSIRTSFMRWSQAWMFLAAAALLEHSGDSRCDNHDARLADAV